MGIALPALSYNTWGRDSQPREPAGSDGLMVRYRDLSSAMCWFLLPEWACNKADRISIAVRLYSVIMLPAQYSGLHCDLCLSDNLLAVLNDKTLGIVADTLSCNIVCWRVDILVYLYGVDRCGATLKFETIEAKF